MRVDGIWFNESTRMYIEAGGRMSWFEYGLCREVRAGDLSPVSTPLENEEFRRAAHLRPMDDDEFVGARLMLKMWGIEVAR